MQRNLKYAILGLLCGEDLTGYEIAQKYGDTLVQFWNAKHSQIYPELKKLTEEGAVEYSVEISSNMLEKKVYSITEEGRNDFLRWLETIEPMPHTPKDIFRLRLFFSNYLDDEKRMRLITEQLSEHEHRRDWLIREMNKFNGIVPQKGTPEFADYLVLTGSIMREESQVNWLNRCRLLYGE